MVEPRMIESGEEDRRPYAPAANVLSVIDRARRLNLPPAVDTDFLRLADVPEGSLGRVAFAMRFLGLTEANERPTEQLRAIARATDEEYRELFAGIVRSAYAADFQRVNPGEETQAKIVSAFQRYEPRSQTTRMVMLFLGLAKAAGIPVLEAPRERGNQVKPSRTPARAAIPVRGRTANPARPTTGRGTVQPPANGASPGNLLFGVTVDDIAVLSDDEFTTVWSALGKIARARARPLQGMAPEVPEDDQAPE